MAGVTSDIIVQRTIKLGFTIDDEEAEMLKSWVQNSQHTSESQKERDFRETIWRAVHAATSKG